MKRTTLLILGLAFLLQSCIIKSIQPFYLKDSITSDDRITGTWKSAKSSSWEIVSFKDEWERESDPNTKLSKEDKEVFERFKDAYYVHYTWKDSEASFIAMPFMVNDALFLDFTPFEYDSDDLNPLVAQHLLKTHSAAHVQFDEDGTMQLKWLSEKSVKNLLQANKLRLKHEVTGIDEDIVLTATSEELYAFLTKFMTIEDDSKWDKDDIYTLTRTDAKP